MKSDVDWEMMTMNREQKLANYASEFSGLLDLLVMYYLETDKTERDLIAADIEECLKDLDKHVSSL